MPEGGSGRVLGSREGGGWRGCRRVVIAWTLFSDFVSKLFIGTSLERDGRGEEKVREGKGGGGTHEMSLLVPGNRLYSVYSARLRSRAGRSARRLY
jgi:hypothetical protein